RLHLMRQRREGAIAGTEGVGGVDRELAARTGDRGQGRFDGVTRNGDHHHVGRRGVTAATAQGRGGVTGSAPEAGQASADVAAPDDDDVHWWAPIMRSAGATSRWRISPMPSIQLTSSSPAAR